MGMDLSGKGGSSFYWNSGMWHKVLILAEESGWQATGTGAPRGIRIADWEGGYFSNDGQRVYVRDARNLADALDRALQAMPAVPADPNSEQWLLSLPGREELQRFSAFCRAGTFRIY